MKLALKVLHPARLPPWSLRADAWDRYSRHDSKPLRQDRERSMRGES